MPEDIEVWAPEFRPGWPDILPLGLIVARSQLNQRQPDPEQELDLDADDDVRWMLHMGLGPEAPRLAFIGDLTVKNAWAFAGVAVIMPFALRDEPDEILTEDSDDLLRQYGDWASSVMYDFAATALRTAMAGNGLPLDVPVGTPRAELHTSDVDAADETQH